MRKVILDGKKIKNREQLFASMKDQLGCADSVGSNLDALHDVLTEQPETPEVEIRNPEALRWHLGDYMDRLLRFLSELP